MRAQARLMTIPSGEASMSESLQRRLDQHREASAAGRPPEINATIARTVRALRDSGAGSAAPAAGARAPDFALPGVHGELVRLGDLLARGPVVLAFYRGVW
jgi:hypothetical protein